MAKLIIFNADDYNLTPGVNEGILRAHREGVVRSTSIMINLPGATNSVAKLNQHLSLSKGLHVNLTYGSPVLPAEEVSSLVDESGKFWHRPHILAEHGLVEEMEKEMEAQVDLALKSGLKLSHLDTHHHAHQVIPGILKILMKLAKRFNLAIRQVDPEMKRILNENGIPTPDDFCGDFYGEEKVNIETIDRVMGLSPGEILEIMCHPGYADEELLNISSYNQTRETELKVLTQPEIFQAVHSHNAQLGSYVDVLERYPVKNNFV